MSAPRLCHALPALVLAVAVAGVARAHPLAPYLLELRELGNGRVAARWKAPLLQPTGSDVRPKLPSRCREDEPARAHRDSDSVSYEWAAQCGGGIVGGTLGATGLRDSKSNVLVRVVLGNGRVVRGLLDEWQPTLAIPAEQRPLAVLLDYLSLGVTHLLTGLDHLLFVFGLVLLVPHRKRLLGTITSFTAGHSVTLSLAALGFVRVSPAAVELGIAITILVLAVELTRSEPAGASALRRRPWLMAFAFGLLHGLGFAGALAQVGLPATDIPLALFAFNGGLELAQIAFVAAVLLLMAATRHLAARAPAWAALAPAYVIGSLAVLWCCERAAVLF